MAWRVPYAHLFFPKKQLKVLRLGVAQMPARCVAESGDGTRCLEDAAYYDKEDKRRWCAAHAPESSSKSKLRKSCEVCAKTAVYGHPPTRCADHATSPLKNCEACGLRAATTIVHVAFMGRTGARVCDACATDATKRCEDASRSWKPRCTHIGDDGSQCDKTRSYGFEYGAALFCAAHRQPGTVNVRRPPRCQTPRCSRPAEYGDIKTRWCKTHAPARAQRCAYLVCEAAECTRHASYALHGDAFSKQLRWCDQHAPSSAHLVFNF